VITLLSNTVADIEKPPMGIKPLIARSIEVQNTIEISTRFTSVSGFGSSDTANKHAAGCFGHRSLTPSSLIGSLENQRLIGDSSSPLYHIDKDSSQIEQMSR
jgi:hypothetical protein